MNVGSIVPALRYFAIALSGGAVRGLIWRIDYFSRGAITAAVVYQLFDRSRKKRGQLRVA
ncbi:hypothetical protein [Rhizobium sp. 11515TR]|uniref:hypothetical protein n=1 Tax=Rhizobium sp. 11515TR TaxID=2028343 RepID=UPI001304083B|nr:hypothetical protein [Rhizobium sp. 11515TR]